MEIEFSGRALTFEEQVQYLEKQGLVVENRQRALHILENVSYARLKSYIVPLMADRSSHKFIPGASFEQAYTLYGFDRRLRELVFHELEKVEISIRTRIAYASMTDEGGFWYTNPSYFSDVRKHKSLLRIIDSELRRSENDAIRRFRGKYSNRFPPCWIALEASSMGTLVMLYDDIRPGKFKNKLCAYYGLTDEVFSSWLHYLVDVRNICAHHNRLWNHTMSSEALIPQSPLRRFPPQNSVEAGRNAYMTLCILRYMINIIKPSNTFARRLMNLLDAFPQIDKSPMGFAPAWRDDPFWK